MSADASSLPRFYKPVVKKFWISVIGVGVVGTGFLIYCFSLRFPELLNIPSVVQWAAQQWELLKLWAVDRFGTDGLWGARIVVSLMGLTFLVLFGHFGIRKMGKIWAVVGSIYLLIALCAAGAVWAIPAIRAELPGIILAMSHVAQNGWYEAIAGCSAAAAGAVFFSYTQLGKASVIVGLMTFATSLAEAGLATFEHLNKSESLLGLLIYVATMFVFGIHTLHLWSQRKHWEHGGINVPIAEVSKVQLPPP